MNLGNIFQSKNQEIKQTNMNGTGSTVPAGDRNYRGQSEIRNMVPGQTVQGEVVGREGNTVQIALDEETVLTAKLERDLNIALGQNMSFEIKTNNGSQISLAPLYANMANQATILKALSAAGLSASAGNIRMVSNMMQEGMPIDRDSIAYVSRQLIDFPNADPASVMQMIRLGLPVTEINIEQFELYKNYEHQILQSAGQIMEEIPQVFQELLAEGKEAEAVLFYQQVIKALTGNESGGENAGLPGDTAAGESGTEGNAGISGNVSEGSMGEALPGASDRTAGGPETVRTPDGAEILLKELAEGEKAEAKDALQDAAGRGMTEQEPAGRTELSAKTWQSLANMLQKMGTDAELAKQIGSGNLSPKAVLSQIQHLSESAGAKSVQNLQNNVDFMNQMNHLFTYIQLPLKMTGNEAHGDLYVYTNKKSLAKKDGNVSALLHLDMENLGPLDVYVTMQKNLNKVSASFTVKDEAALNLIADHIHILNERLEKRGYSMKANFQIKEDGPTNVMQEILEQNKNISVLSKTSFDMRA